MREERRKENINLRTDILLLQQEIKELSKKLEVSEISKMQHRERLYGIYSWKEQWEGYVRKIDAAVTNWADELKEFRKYIDEQVNDPSTGIRTQLSRNQESIKTQAQKLTDHQRFDTWRYAAIATVQTALIGVLIKMIIG